MVAILGGLAAACSWAVATLASSRSSRMIGPWSVLGWVMAVGLVVAIVPALLVKPVDLDAPKLAGLIAVGLCQNIGLLLAYYALQVGRVSIVAPITSTEGAMAAVLAVILGEPLALPTALVLAVIAIGVVMAAVERSRDDRVVDPARTARDLAHPQRAILLAVAAAVVFSVGLVLSGRLGAAGIPPLWVIVASRTVGVLLIALPLVLTRRVQLTRPAVPLVLLAGVLEAVGSGVYVVAASVDIAVAAVLSSQFAAIVAVGGFVLFGERLQRIQVAGVVLIAVGVTILSAVSG
ncbi:MAG: DMT family transporter [Chloroflexi bacterium]|nr:DMT family transporter [Chloroflexota bacterium]